MARFTHPAIGPYNASDIITNINSYNPVWSGTGLTFTGTPATGSYIKIGNFISVQINVSFATVTNFGTGQYSLTLPFASKYHTDVFAGSVHKIQPSGTEHYSLKGHLAAASNIMTLWDISGSGKDEPFDHNSPFILETDELFHMYLTYISE